ncbi:MAG: hypothetical protein MSH20_10600 [Lachnospiraceae bacterium]|nr:hypothetical protein [Lachnospiraceae bacterium]
MTGTAFRTMAVSAVFVLVATFFVTMTVKSQSNHDELMEQKYYDELESNYIEQVEAVLERNGLSNSGINMTRVSDADGSRVYTVVIHNSYFGRMETKKLTRVEQEVRAVSFADETSRFCHEFMGGKSSGKGL